MRILIRGIKKILRSQKGELLVESLVSLAILSILLTTVTAMVQFSLRVTYNTTQNAMAQQEDILNPIIWTDYDGSSPTVTAAKITFTETLVTDGIEAFHDVYFNTDGGFIAFTPQ